MDMNKINVKVEEFKADYANVLIEKENDLAIGMAELETRVAQEIEAIREEIRENVIIAIKAENKEKFDSKVEFFEKYLEEIVEEPIIEEAIVEEVVSEVVAEENIIE